MRLFGLVDGVIDNNDRPMTFGLPFTLAFRDAIVVTPWHTTEWNASRFVGTWQADIRDSGWVSETQDTSWKAEAGKWDL